MYFITKNLNSSDDCSVTIENRTRDPPLFYGFPRRLWLEDILTLEINIDCSKMALFKYYGVNRWIVTQDQRRGGLG